MESSIDLDGAVDIHTHCGPSVVPRRVDGYELARDCALAGLDAVVMKEHFIPTVFAVEFIDRLLARDELEIEVMGSLVMNRCNGGFNPEMVDIAIDFGAKVIWGPTIDAKHHIEKGQSQPSHPGERSGDLNGDQQPGLYALNTNGNLKNSVKKCLDIIADNNVVMGLGHLSFEETIQIIDYLTNRGHDGIFVDHPNYYVTDFDPDQQQAIVDTGTLLNFHFASISPKFHWQTPSELAESIRRFGVENILLSSDVGQIGNPNAVESLQLLGELLLEENISRSDYRSMIVERPKNLLGLN